MKIRKATSQDSSRIANLVIHAMEDIIYSFIGEKSMAKSIVFLTGLIQEKGNQYSFENCWIGEDENDVLAAVIVYDGGKLDELRQPVAERINTMFNRQLVAEDETEAGEYYIDCLAVNANAQGKGIGSAVLNFLINEYVISQKKILGLLVDNENPRARNLYLKLGFEFIKYKSLAGKTLAHLQIKP